VKKSIKHFLWDGDFWEYFRVLLCCSHSAHAPQVLQTIRICVRTSRNCEAIYHSNKWTYVTLCTSKIRQLQCIGHTSSLQLEHFILKKSPALVVLCNTRSTKKISNVIFCAIEKENIEATCWNVRELSDMRSQMGTSRRKTFVRAGCSFWVTKRHSSKSNKTSEITPT